MQMILVTGATGFLGRHLVSGLVSAGYRVRVLVRNPHSRKLDLPEGVEVAEGDILDMVSLESALEGVSQVVHAAAVVSFWKKRQQEMSQINVQGTAQVVNACIEAGISRLVYLSSVGVFGRMNNEVITESLQVRPGRGHSFYGKTKYLAEREVERGIAEGLETVILNPGVILGTGDWQTGTPKIFSVVSKGLRFYNQGKTGVVGVQDVVAAVKLGLEGRLPAGERFLLVAESIPQQVFLGMIAQGLQLAPPKIGLPAWVSLLVGRISETFANLTGKEPVISLETMRSSVRQTTYDGSKITRHGLTYTPVAQVIAETAAAFRNEFPR